MAGLDGEIEMELRVGGGGGVPEPDAALKAIICMIQGAEELRGALAE
jgi:hypothetical protein